MNPARRAIEAASAAFGVPISAIMGPCRKRRVSDARRAAMRLLHEREWSSTMIGRALGGLDHTSILHGLKRVGDMPPEWHAAYRKARDFMRPFAAPAWRIVYNRPIGPPLCPFRNKVNCGRPHAPPKPRPPSPDEVWAKCLGGSVTLAFTRRALNEIGGRGSTVAPIEKQSQPQRVQRATGLS